MGYPATSGGSAVLIHPVQRTQAADLQTSEPKGPERHSLPHANRPFLRRILSVTEKDRGTKKDRGSGSGHLSKALLTFCLGCFVLAGGCTTQHRAALVQTGQAPAISPKLLAVYMPWFGDHSHIDVGYSSNDPAVLRKQIQQARRMGISGFVVDWYGESRPFSDHNFALLQQAAAEDHFQVALLYNESEDEQEQATDDAIAALDKAYNAYIGPTARYHDAYLTFHGRTLFFIFPKSKHVDWNKVQEHCSSWEHPPLMIYKDEPPGAYSNAFAGSYAWVQPGAEGWSADGSNWGEQYLQYFYRTMKSKYSGKIIIGGAWPGFNDSAAKWGLNRKMQSRCGKTFEETLSFYQNYYDNSNPIPFLLIETCNDY